MDAFEVGMVRLAAQKRRQARWMEPAALGWWWFPAVVLPGGVDGLYEGLRPIGPID